MSSDNKNKLGGLLDSISNELAKLPHPAANGISTVPPPPPPPPQSPSETAFGLLAQYLSRPEARGLYYNGKIIKLDGFKWIGCRFDNCKLIVASTNFELEECVVDPSTVVEFTAEPLKLIRLFNYKNDWAYAGTADFAPRKNADGSITVNGAPR